MVGRQLQFNYENDLAERYMPYRFLPFIAAAPKDDTPNPVHLKMYTITLLRPEVRVYDETMYIIQRIGRSCGNKKRQIRWRDKIKEALEAEAIKLFPEFKNIEIVLIKKYE